MLFELLPHRRCLTCTLNCLDALALFSLTVRSSSGNYLSALVFIEEGNPDFINAGTPEAPRQLINFKKRRLVSRVIEEMRTWQVGGYYALIPVPSIVDFLNNLPEENEDQLYELSLVREPRKKPT
jgi:hypothetical protein